MLGDGQFLSRRDIFVYVWAMSVSNFQIVFAIIVVAVATFINLPAPQFSKRLQEWRNMGQYFNYRGNAIFYQGKYEYY